LLDHFIIQDDLLLHVPVQVTIFHMPKTYWKVVLVTPLSKAFMMTDKITGKLLLYLIGFIMLAIAGIFFLLQTVFVKPIKS